MSFFEVGSFQPIVIAIKAIILHTVGGPGKPSTLHHPIILESFF